MTDYASVPKAWDLLLLLLLLHTPQQCCFWLCTMNKPLLCMYMILTACRCLRVCTLLQLLRRIALESSGPEAPVLRRLASSKGRGFLAHFSPTVGNPFGGTPEWDYFRCVCLSVGVCGCV